MNEEEQKQILTKKIKQVNVLLVVGVLLALAHHPVLALTTCVLVYMMMTGVYDFNSNIFMANAIQNLVIDADFKDMDCYEFEEWTADFFECTSQFTAKTTKKSGDNGIDVILTDVDTGEVAYVQCKMYSEENKVGEQVIRDLYGAMSADGVSKGYVITTSSYTQQAQNWVRDKRANIMLLNAHDLKKVASQVIQPPLVEEIKTGWQTFTLIVTVVLVVLSIIA